MNKHTQASWGLDTLLIHGGESHHFEHPNGMPTVQPIYTSTTYLHPSAAALDEAFSDNSPLGEQT
jgi:cystathionine gamma-synthase/methionine-gamma-lyase